MDFGEGHVFCGQRDEGYVRRRRRRGKEIGSPSQQKYGELRETCTHPHILQYCILTVHMVAVCHFEEKFFHHFDLEITSQATMRQHSQVCDYAVDGRGKSKSTYSTHAHLPVAFSLSARRRVISLMHRNASPLESYRIQTEVPRRS